MARNLKKDYLKKLYNIRTSNGYKVHLNQYIYGFAHGDEYPKLIKLIEETETTKTYSSVYYFKYYNGTGKYFHKIYSVPNNNDSVNISTEIQETELETNNRFNLNKLIQLAETM